MNTLNLTKKEIRDYFSTPVAYIVLVVFGVIIGVYFSQFVFVDNQASLRKIFEFIPMLWIIFIPAITMKSFSEELKTGTLEVLATLPVSKKQIIISKVLSNLFVAFVMLLSTLPLAYTIIKLGNPDIGQIIISYLGLLLVASAYIFVGIVVSINSRNQIVAFILSSFVIALLYFIGEVQVLNFVPNKYRDFFEFLGMGSHYKSIAKGVVDSRDIIYYLSLLVLLYQLILISFNRIQKKGK